MQQKIVISQLACSALIGVHAYERVQKQPLSIDLELITAVDFGKQNDQIETVVDYSTICQNVLAWVEASSFELLESLTHYLLKQLLEDQRIQSVKLRASKPEAIAQAQSVAIELVASQTDL